jgi:uncharacterized protein YjiS (DUF1127 family)
MAIPYVESTQRQPGARFWTIHRHSRFFGWLGGFITAWANIRATRITLDDMSYGQLEEIGMRRTTRGVMWLDCRESPLGDIEYRRAPREQRS